MSIESSTKRHLLIEEVSTSLTALEAFELFRERPFSFFLDSGMDPEKLGRYSFMGSDPFLVLKSRGRQITLVYRDWEEIVIGNPFDVLGGLLEKYALAPYSSPIPLVGGAVGYFSYDLCHFIERLPSTAIDDLHIPECYLAFYDAILAFDHLERRAYIVATGFPEQEENKRGKRAKERIEELKDMITEAPRPEEALPRCIGGVVAGAKSSKLRANFTYEEYVKAVDAVREYIASGDIFQVNLSQRFEVDFPIAPYELYRRLRLVNPAPFACYLNFDDVAIAGASPERFLRVWGDLVQTRPIKGTRPRGNSATEDEALARELLQSVKDRAENVMIVDLERNDLGRVCRYGTVRVRELWALERYATVFHLTSTVEGRLRQDKNCIDLLKATFPGGSITGAPKVRAMEIIDELEPTKRSVYTGSIGYLSFNGEMDLNIVIRTFLIKNGKAYFQVGGGIVYDSDPEAEYVETLDKAKALIEALNLSPITVAK
ncbi:MAG: aminodeoxychorismate synthase component I [Dehalococcoidia bacterium]|nr:aminodeoxychorismate synthase component I [Dehalococcoidia bacterium]